MVTKTDTSKNSKDSEHRVLCPLCQEYFLDAELDIHMEYDHIKANSVIEKIMVDDFKRKLRKINLCYVPPYIETIKGKTN